MIKDLYWLIILFILAMFFYYSNKNSSQYLINEGFKNSKVYIGYSPIKANNILSMDNAKFGSNSIYEVGKIVTPDNKRYKPRLLDYYPGNYENNYF